MRSLHKSTTIVSRLLMSRLILCPLTKVWPFWNWTSLRICSQNHRTIYKTQMVQLIQTLVLVVIAPATLMASRIHPEVELPVRTRGTKLYRERLWAKWDQSKWTGEIFIMLCLMVEYTMENKYGNNKGASMLLAGDDAERDDDSCIEIISWFMIEENELLAPITCGSNVY